MTKTALPDIDRAIADLPQQFKGPGGAVAVVKDGAVIARHAWGFADLERRVPFSPETLFPICSISKQFTCALLLDRFADPDQLDDALRARMPKLRDKPPRIVDLCHNQSGLRDYWALTVLSGAKPEGQFRPADAEALIGQTETLHFPAGSQYSYSNGNFRLVSDMIETAAKEDFGKLLLERILGPAGMATARLHPETGTLPGGVVGYEGNEAFGFIPAVNNIHWTGDAGIVASLDDMIAWEHFIDRTRDDANGLYRRLSARPVFADGRPAYYGFGLAFMYSNGLALTGHGGALRGFRCHRVHAAAERLSVVVLFNHQSSAREASMRVLRASLGQAEPACKAIAYDPQWTGAYFDPATGLLLDISEGAKDGQVSARFTTDAEMLDLTSAHQAASPAMTLKRDGDIIQLTRAADNLNGTLSRLDGEAQTDIAGRFHSAELDAVFEITERGGAFYGAFEGPLGKGAMQPLYPAGPDIWRLLCQRSMDAPAPGIWTLTFERDSGGRITSVSVGCWLARKVRFERRDRQGF
ncbi:D-aminopeptidase [Nordella sp. HKS 07]|uniref:D-aminopeptidase n=1 Tax=Nordella sp. HKS 07 TaxID=2712222 RepID=UPI0013E1AA28|nr:D-aminopeptidase [Nordella sp. HKS 07]QIG50171.1 D-aminopeptidase [Nordella sp. HKS 07]